VTIANNSTNSASNKCYYKVEHKKWYKTHEHTSIACEICVYNDNIPKMDKTKKNINITPDVTMAFFCSRLTITVTIVYKSTEILLPLT